jgi:acyl-CoA thioester hydrolase
MTDAPLLADFPARAGDTVRYGDTDRQGHVNNAVFFTFLETGRTQLLLASQGPPLEPGTSLVLAHVALDFLAEIHWPGSVSIGTRVTSVGRSSIRFEQALFQDDRCVATAQSVTVLVDNATRRSTPITPTLRSHFERLAAP